MTQSQTNNSFQLMIQSLSYPVPADLLIRDICSLDSQYYCTWYQCMVIYARITFIFLFQFLVLVGDHQDKYITISFAHSFQTVVGYLMHMKLLILASLMLQMAIFQINESITLQQYELWDYTITLCITLSCLHLVAMNICTVVNYFTENLKHTAYLILLVTYHLQCKKNPVDLYVHLLQ